MGAVCSPELVESLTAISRLIVAAGHSHQPLIILGRSYAYRHFRFNRKGKSLPGFDYGNSPTEIEAIDFSGKTIIQTTSAGTQGFANAKEADELISGSFVNAGAIVSYIKEKAPERVSLVCMGTWAVTPADEDRLCAEYIADQLNSKKLSREDVYNKLKVAKTAKIFFDPDIKWAPEKDFDLCLNIGLCDFVLKAEKIENGLLALRPIYS